MKTEHRPLPTIIILLALINLLIHLITTGFFNYGIFRDELYYLACTKRLDFGYVDHPPFSIYILALWKLVFGDSLFAIRLIPALVSTLSLFMLGIVTKRLGGKRPAIIIAVLAFMTTPIFLGMNTIFSMNTFDFLFWITSTYFLLRIVQEENQKMWIWLGIVIGLGLLNKTSMLWLAAGILGATVFTPLRKDLKTKYPYLAVLIALLIFSPFIIWNILHDFAHLEFMQNAATRKYGGLTPISFIADQLLILNPLSILIWLPGFYFFFFDDAGKKVKAVVFIWIITFVILFINGHSKGEYIAPAYQILFAGGAVIIEKWSVTKAWLKYTIAIPIILASLFFTPFARPLLSPESFLKYQNLIGLKPPSNEGHETILPQFYSDMFGWEDLAKQVSKVYQSIPKSEQDKTVVYCSNYGKAGAIEYFSKKYNLPKVICPHNSYWFWWPMSNDYSTLIIIGGEIEDHLTSIKDVRAITTYQTDYAMPYENNLTIYVGRGFIRSLQTIRMSNKIFI
ncbi:MAG: glycosyltransferase family 39 protein [Ignavibacteriaceae bacterium]|nr:glycosyltransferase family 39 protein [Ignavibacteriaceae bacterium]